MIIAENLTLSRMSKKQKAYVIFAISFVTGKDIFIYQLFKNGLNRCLSSKSNMSNVWLMMDKSLEWMLKFRSSRWNIV